MSMLAAAIVAIVLIGAVWWLVYLLAAKSFSRLIKYGPAAGFAAGIAFFYGKSVFFATGYSAILDIIAILILTVALVIALLAAVMIELAGARRRGSRS